MSCSDLTILPFVLMAAVFCAILITGEISSHRYRQRLEQESREFNKKMLKIAETFKK